MFMNQRKNLVYERDSSNIVSEILVASTYAKILHESRDI